MKQPFFPVFHFCLQGLVIRLGVFAFLLVLILISFKNFIGFYIENYRPFCLFTMSFFLRLPIPVASVRYLPIRFLLMLTVDVHTNVYLNRGARGMETSWILLRIQIYRKTADFEIESFCWSCKI